MSGYIDNNPKTKFGMTKVGLHLIPPAAKIYMALAFMDGARKYGPYNWRANKVSASIYLAACQRHIDAWMDGEKLADDSTVPHLGHAMACLGILIDALESGNLIDDRPLPGPASRLQKEWIRPIDPPNPVAAHLVDMPVQDGSEKAEAWVKENLGKRKPISKKKIAQAVAKVKKGKGK